MTPPPRIERLLAALHQPHRLILGLMSGTSLDGLDLALCRFSGHGGATRWELPHWKTVPYSPTQQTRLRGVVSRERVGLANLTVAHAWLAEIHAAGVLAALEEWGVAPAEVTCLASHGQTVYHAPDRWKHQGQRRHATLQIGDGDLLARRTDILTLSDFRQKEIAGGGQGAPLAPYAERILFGGAAHPRVLINLGGIANFTWLPAAGDPRLPLSGDTGPAGTLLDLAVRRFFPRNRQGFDRGGKIAAGGRIQPALLQGLLAHPYFGLPFPKSTGPEMFGEAYLEQALADAARQGAAPGTPADILATLAALSAETIAQALRREVPQLDKAEIYLSGGGRHNATLKGQLAQRLGGLELGDSGQLGLPPDAKEAALFAVLANESLWGEGFSVGGAAGPERIGFGKISLPA